MAHTLSLVGALILNTMDLDSKISFFAGYIFTAASTITIVGFLNAAAIGLIGGFFGLLGKEVYYYVKGEYHSWIDKIKQWLKK
jgi:hypothetical protein